MSIKRHFYNSTNICINYTIKKENCIFETYMLKGVSTLSFILMIIFGLIAIFSVVGAFQGIKEKNVLSVVFHLAAAVVLGWFVVMTVLNSGYPPVHH